MYTVLVLGGYGFFGQRICTELSFNQNLKVLIAGRHLHKARSLALELGFPLDQAIKLDASDSRLAEYLSELKVDVIIHTAGPFQGQAYHVARSAIAAGAHYIDLADGREFVEGISSLNSIACEQKVCVVSGASSLPALSSAVVDQYAGHFSILESIRHGISSGARSPGLATMQGIFSYAGKSFSRLEGGHWKSCYGWLDTQSYCFPKPVGRRFLGSCDVPDLVLFPLRYPTVRTVTFHAGFASALGHCVVWFGAKLVRFRVVKSLVSWCHYLHHISRKIERWISDQGAMFVCLQGYDKKGRPLKIIWHLLALKNHGPYIPCGAAIALVHKLSRKEPIPYGAFPCVGLLSVEEYLNALKRFDVIECPPDLDNISFL
jgi:saccharopine dehydrogenase-like NADP-dependent oxidoreductase